MSPSIPAPAWVVGLGELAALRSVLESRQSIGSFFQRPPSSPALAHLSCHNDSGRAAPSATAAFLQALIMLPSLHSDRASRVETTY